MAGETLRLFVKVVWAFAIIGWVYIHFLLLHTIAVCLNRCEPRNRKLNPKLVWLNLIPGFKILFGVITWQQVDASLMLEFRDREMDQNGQEPHGVYGLFAMASGLCWFCFPFNFLFAATLGLFYWLRIYQISRQLAETPSFRQEQEYIPLESEGL